MHWCYINAFISWRILRRFDSGPRLSRVPVGPCDSVLPWNMEWCAGKALWIPAQDTPMLCTQRSDFPGQERISENRSGSKQVHAVRKYESYGNVWRNAWNRLKSSQLWYLTCPQHWIFMGFRSTELLTYATWIWEEAWALPCLAAMCSILLFNFAVEPVRLSELFKKISMLNMSRS